MVRPAISPIKPQPSLVFHTTIIATSPQTMHQKGIRTLASLCHVSYVVTPDLTESAENNGLTYRSFDITMALALGRRFMGQVIKAEAVQYTIITTTAMKDDRTLIIIMSPRLPPAVTPCFLLRTCHTQFKPTS